MDDNKYLELLDKAYEELPEVLHKKERFEIPKVKGKLIKTRTHINNFKQIASDFTRSEEHLLKYFLKEAGVRGEINFRGELVLHSRFQPSKLNSIVESYYHTYVECPYCKSPDTTMNKDAVGITCKACGHQEQLDKL